MTAVPGTPAGTGPPGAPEPARPADPARHEAMLHTSPADLAAQLTPRVQAALGAGNVVVAVLAKEHEAALRESLGAAADGVEFGDPEQVHRVPAFTVAVRFARACRRSGRADGALVIGQHLPGLPGRGPEHWARLDIALNVAIAGLPITVLCPYAADDPDLRRARTTHPVLTAAEGSAVSAEYRPPQDSLIDYPPPPAPGLGTPVSELSFGAAELVALRHLVGEVAAAAGLAPDRAADLVLAVNELASNSVEHGPGSGVLRIWTDPEEEAGTALVAEVADHGGGLMDMPFPGLALPPPDGTRGRGLWLASELCDVLQVWSDADATVVRVHVSR
ncbi:ATP-binding protein [Pseudonocardia sp.]|uniref:ATP-binding protein n=1 Tax=Pseudonocardia sp. TaxID=60912 RepID=UPI0026052956|nr:ATP-binding protein [Pseudonocardia sp.]